MSFIEDNKVRNLVVLDLEKYREDARALVKKLYKDDQGRPIILTDGQCDLFNVIFKKLYPRVHISGMTRYGKSLVIALALLTRISNIPERWSIAAGSDKQAGIIMSHLIQHIFDNTYTASRYQMEEGETAEQIRRYRNKSRINFRVGEAGGKMLLGEVFITNAKGALGFGAPNVIGDESALIPDDEEALIFRMLGDMVDESFYCKIGNPWESGHFRSSFKDPKFYKIKIDYHQAIIEGRITQDFVNEVQKKPFFDVLYESNFPPRDTMDDEGWMPLLVQDDIDRALIPSGEGFGVNKLGGDVAGGGKNFSVLVQRYTNLARMLVKNKDADTMNFAESILNIRKREGVKGQDIMIDKVGAGLGCYNILAREIEGVYGLNAGEKPQNEADREMYINLRALMYWKAREWILAGGKLLLAEGESLEDTWYQLTKIKYKRKLEGMRGKLQIMPKEQMLKLGIESPDVADAFAFTFVTPDVVWPDAPQGGTNDGDALMEKFGLFPKV